MRHFQAFEATLFTLFVAACGGGAGGSGGGGTSTNTSSGTSGSGGSSGSTTSSSSGTTSTSSSSGGGTGGSTAVCSPSPVDPMASQCTTECKCAMPPNFIPDAPCPNTMGNVCSAGHNQCGCDMPLKMDYEAPDANCLAFVSGDDWVDDTGQFHGTATLDLVLSANGQTQISFGALWDGGLLSGKKIWNNRSNASAYDSYDGEFGADCMSVTANSYSAGSSTPLQTMHFLWNHHSQ